MSRIALRLLFACCIVSFFVSFAQAQTDITTWQVDLNHTGANTHETVLTPALVKGAGNLTVAFTQQLDGIVNAQPLYLSAATSNNLPGQFSDGASHNVVYLVTQNATVFAFDADVDRQGANPNGTNSDPLWKTSLLNTSTAKALPASDSGSGDITPLLGATETPVIDPATGTLYVVAAIKDSALNPPYEQLLYALDVKTGRIKQGPVNIALEFNGTPTTNNGDLDPVTPSGPGKIPFSPLHEHLRGSMAFYNGMLYLVYASHSDTTPYYGEILGYKASTLALTSKFITSPNNAGYAGIWQGGAGPIIDETGNLYVMTGNGNFDQNSGAPYTTATNWGESVLRLNPGTLDSNGNILLSYSSDPHGNGWFTPNNWSQLNAGTPTVGGTPGLPNDRDLGAGGLLALPDQTQGSHTHIMVGGGKAGVLYVLDRDVLGGNTANDSGAIQELSNPSGAAIFSTPAYFNGYIYYGDATNAVTQRQVTYDNALTPPTYISSTPIISNASAPSKSGGVFISGNGASNGVVWQLSNALRAWDATNVTNTIYNVSTTSPASKSSGCTTQRWHLPIVVNGKVYFSCFDNNNIGYLFVVGVAPTPAGVPSQPASVNAMANSESQITVTWTNTASNQTGFSVYRSGYSDGGFTLVTSSLPSNATSYVDSGLSPGQMYYYQIEATNSAGPSLAGEAGTQTLTAFKPAGLIAYWPLDEGLTSGTANTAVDASGNNHSATKDGTSEAEPIATGCYINGCWAFHGTKADDRLVVNDAPDLDFTASQSFTLSAWIYPEKVDGNEYSIIDKSVDQGSPYGIYINAANHWVARGPQGDLVGTAAQANTWTHVTLVQNGATGLRYLYINGVQQPTTAPAQAANGQGQLWMGEQNSTSNVDGFEGNLDEVRLYNIALTPTAVQDEMSDPVVQAQSLLQQGSNDFGVVLSPAIVPQTEPRIPTTPGSYTLQVQFAAPVTTTVTAALQPQAGVAQSPVGTVGTLSFDSTGTVLTVPLTGVGNSQALNLHLANVGTSTSSPGVADIAFDILQGDVSGDHSVDSFDTAAVSANYNSTGTTPVATTAIYDVNGDGIINAADVAAVTNAENTAWAPQVDTNLAIFKKATASSVSTQNTGNVAQDAVDNNLNTTWESVRPGNGNATTGVSGVDPSWIFVDLGHTATVDGASVAWDNAAASQYVIQSCQVLSSDGVDCTDSSGWNPMVTELNNPGNETKTYVGLTPVAARYFRMYGTSRTQAPYGYQLKEFQVLGFYGTASTTTPPPPSAPAITSAATATATAGQAFTYTITSNPAASTYSASPLPGNLSLSGATISGTPTTAGTYQITLGATNATGQTGSATLTLTVNAAQAATPAITSATTATATAGQAFTYTITSNPAASTYSASPLPGNLSLSGATISGTPTTAGTYQITLGATNATGQTGSATLTLTVSAATGGAAIGTPVFQIDAGSAVPVAPFAADQFASAASVTTSNNAITLPSGIVNPAPAKVYQSNRYGTFTYMFQGLGATQPYTVRLHFAETYFSTQNSRVFNVTIGTQVVLPAFDIVKAAGGENIANIQTFNVNSDQNGNIVIAFAPGAGGQNNPQVNGIEILTNGGPVPTPVPPVSVVAMEGNNRTTLSWSPGSGSTGTYSVFRGTKSGAEAATPLASGLMGTTYTDTTSTDGTTYFYTITATNSGVSSNPSTEVSSTPGAAIPGSPVIQLDAGSATAYAPYTADTTFGSASSGTSTTPVNTTGVVSPAPPNVYLTGHQGSSFSYSFPNLIPGATYTVRLHFAETYFPAAGGRIFNVNINNVPVLTNYDIFTAAGGKNVAIVEQFTASPSGSNNTITISFAGTVDQPEVMGIELYH